MANVESSDLEIIYVRKVLFLNLAILSLLPASQNDYCPLNPPQQLLPPNTKSFIIRCMPDMKLTHLQ